MNKYLKIGLVFIISFLLTYFFINMIDKYDAKKIEEENKKKQKQESNKQKVIIGEQQKNKLFTRIKFPQTISTIAKNTLFEIKTQKNSI